MKVVILAILLGGGCSRCGSSNDESPSLADIRDLAAYKAKGVADKAKTVGSDVVDVAKRAASKAGDISQDAFDAGSKVKAEVGEKLAGLSFDLALDTRPEAESDYAAKIAGLRTIKVDNYAIAFQQIESHPLGSVYKWQFRFTWRLTNGIAVHLSVFTDKALPEAEMLADLAILVPLAMKIVKPI